MSTTEVQIPESAAQAPDTAPPGPPPPLTVIEPRRGWQLLNVRELWHYRELLYFLTWRDVAVRYKQTVLGAAWAVLQPAMMMVVFTVFLGRMAKVDSGDLPYPVFVYAGLLPWTFFATAVSAAGNSVVGSAHMISKVYCPRLMIPLASVGAAVVDFLIALSLMAVLMVYYGIAPGWGILLLPMVFGLIFLAATGVGTLLAALNVRYRDFKYTIPFLLQIWMFATPTVYMNVEPRANAATQADLPSPSGRGAGGEGTVRPAVGQGDLPSPSGRGAGGEGLAQSPASSPTAAERAGVPSAVKAFLRLNPMTDVIGFFRAATLGGPLPWAQLGSATLVILAVFVAGLAYFRRVESSFADII